MSEHKSFFEKLKTTRDELKVKTHLLEMDIKQEWDDLETKWNKLSQEFEPTRHTTEKVGDNIASATKLLLEEIEKGYKKIKNSLPD